MSTPNDLTKSPITPGPWVYYHDKLRPQFPVWIHEVQDAKGNAVVAWSGFDGVKQSKATIKANAQLIATAPELLESLKALLAMYGPSSEYSYEAQANWERAEAVIAKAEGR